MSSPLTDVLPDKHRKISYAVLFVLALGFAAWQAAQGDWVEFAGGLITALFGATAASNTAPAPAPVDRSYGDDNYYDESHGV